MGWRTSVGTALAIVFSRPDLWLIGSLSIAARGGLLLMAVPVLTLPSPVGISVMLGPAIIDAGTASLQALLIGGAIGLSGLVLISLLLSAVADLMAYDRFVRDPETLEARGGREPRAMSVRRRFSTVGSLAAIQATVLVPAVLAFVMLADRAAVLLQDELIHPSSQVSLLMRMLVGAREQLVLVLIALLVAEVLGSLASRHLLASRYGLGYDRAQVTEARSRRIAVVRLLAAPLMVAARAGLGWLVAAVLVLPVAFALTVAWDEVRELYLAPPTLGPGLVVARVLVTVAFAGLWVVVTLLAGISSALRGALWSSFSLR